MGFETYLIESINQMNSLAVKSEAHPEQRQDCLLEAAVIGCRMLKQLSSDPDFESTLNEFADVRIIRRLQQKASDLDQRRERQLVNEFLTIIDDSTHLEMFLELEREIMIRGGLTLDVVDSLVESMRQSVGSVRERAKPPAEIIDTTRVLRDRACTLANDLVDQAQKDDWWDRASQRVKRILLGLGGGALIGLNSGALATSVGLTAAGSAVSIAIGGAIISSAAADVAKARSANK